MDNKESVIQSTNNNKIQENVCTLCSKEFKNTKTFNNHQKLHTNNKPKKCKRCPTVIFTSYTEYRIHIKKKHREKQSDCFICSDCGKQFKTRNEITLHIQSKCGTVKLYKCEICNQELMNRGSLYNHMRKHNGEPSFMCRFCAKLFLTAGQLKVHERIHTKERAFVCNVCGKGFCHRQSLITHSTLHTGVKPFSCENCGNSFSCIGNLLKHRKTHADCGLTPLTTHRVLNPVTKEKVKVNTPITAKLKQLKKSKELEVIDKEQNSTFDKANVDVNVKTEDDVPKKKMINAINSEEDTLSLQKETCLIKIKSVYDLNKENNDNMREELSTDDDFEIKQEAFDAIESEESQNEEIDEDFKLQYPPKDENGMQQVDENKRNFKCPCCKEIFDDKELYKLHRKNSHPEKFNCQECDKVYSTSYSFRLHQKTVHKGIAKKTYTYVCKRCGKQFKQKFTLTNHEKNNCSKDPLTVCTICGKSFSSIHVRNYHMRVHNSEKKLLCKFCGKSFHWKGQLKIHERSHTGEKPFTCLYCPKAFAYRDSLITHSSLHTGIKPHVCEACGSRFSCIGNLIKHKSTHATTCGEWYANNKNEKISEEG